MVSVHGKKDVITLSNTGDGKTLSTSGGDGNSTIFVEETVTQPRLAKERVEDLTTHLGNEGNDRSMYFCIRTMKKGDATFLQRTEEGGVTPFLQN